MIKSGSAQSLTSMSSQTSAPMTVGPDAVNASVTGSVGVVGASEDAANWKELGGKAADVLAQDDKAGKAAQKAKEAEKKKKNSAYVKRVWGMHEGDSFYFFVGTIGAILVGASNPLVGIIFVSVFGHSSLMTPRRCGTRPSIGLASCSSWPFARQRETQ